MFVYLMVFTIAPVTVMNLLDKYYFGNIIQDTCPNCKAAAALLQKAGIEYLALNANEEKELVEKYGVKQAPTLVLLSGDHVEKYRGVSDIKGWLMKQK